MCVQCWIWVSKRDTRASIPSLAIMSISWYVFPHSAACIAPPRIHFSPFPLRAHSRAPFLIVPRSVTSVTSIYFIQLLFRVYSLVSPQSFGFPKTEVRHLSNSYYFMYLLTSCLVFVPIYSSRLASQRLSLRTQILISSSPTHIHTGARRSKPNFWHPRSSSYPWIHGVQVPQDEGPILVLLIFLKMKII